jgi:Fic family protein
MAKVVRRRWTNEAGPGLPRRDRRTCDYEAYIPDRLAGRPITLDGDVAADVVDAEAAITRLNVEGSALVDTEALARLLLRAESVASSKIEGLEVGGRRLLRAEAARSLGEHTPDVTADEVLGNIDAMVWAVQTSVEAPTITVDQLLEIQRRLLAGTGLEEHAGHFRTEQNWLGGSSYNPCSAAFVPPPPELVEDLVADLCAFCNDDSLPAVAQAAIAHAQFETIHPFIDGNGRTGRALIPMVLRRRGLAPRVLPPISLVLATWAKDYVEGLTATRYRGAPTSRAAHDGLNRWVGLFAGACTRAVNDADAFEARTRDLQAAWHERLGSIRAGSAVDLLIRALPGAPIVTVNSAAELIGRSYQAANEGVARLAEAGVLSQLTIGRRNRAFEAPDLIDAFTDLERQLASPRADTRVSAPARRVSHRR